MCTSNPVMEISCWHTAEKAMPPLCRTSLMHSTRTSKAIPCAGLRNCDQHNSEGARRGWRSMIWQKELQASSAKAGCLHARCKALMRKCEAGVAQGFPFAENPLTARP